MANLDVQPKSSRPWWLWLLLALVALALLFFLMRGCDRNDADVDRTTTTETTTTETTAVTTDDDGDDDDWNDLNLDAPAAAYEEITDKDIDVRGTDNYAVYSLDETILFGSDKSTIQPQAADKLKQVAASLNKRFANGKVRIYGYTDAQGSASYNKELAEERTKAVQAWLTENGNVSKDNVSMHPVGESKPVATNETAAGRQQNRRVQIVARKVK
ncbi:membrane protein [Rufibacter radiotolerans]|uniref:Membrane protein n=1 Tax=Rufibacter radiotolerans TaxID=1379910 RepID=A0A0H4VUK8_9BACT|nr:OmpA family protein [Rufibacter radiotolerans]AKQ47592.1 membrane protein [Rufibacter radiotolerans]